MWFRSDLRLRDNPAFDHACRESTRGVVAVFVVSREQWEQEHDWGPPKVDFVLRSVRALSGALAERDVALRVLDVSRFADVPAALLELAEAHDCDRLCFNREHEVNEQRRDEQVIAAFERAGRSVRSFVDQFALPPEHVRTQDGDTYRVYTPFRRRWNDALREVGGLKTLQLPRRPESLGLSADDVPRGEGVTGRLAELWPAGEDEAARRLESFLAKRVGEYADRRDYPAEDATSALSPYLAVGAISVRQCLDAAIEANHGRVDGGQAGLKTWIGELLWREFYRHVLIGYPRVSMGRAFRPETEALPWREDAEGLAAWQEGRTGIPIVDAGMRQLRETGWMHNRLRMIVAMLLTKNLLIDWRAGERHFMRHLVDGDLGNNNGGWQWSASTGTDAVPYFRVFNPVTQGRRYDPQGTFIRRYVPELRDVSDEDIHEPQRGGRVAGGANEYPPPVVDLKTSRQRALEVFKSLSDAR